MIDKIESLLDDIETQSKCFSGVHLWRRTWVGLNQQTIHWSQLDTEGFYWVCDHCGTESFEYYAPEGEIVTWDENWPEPHVDHGLN